MGDPGWIDRPDLDGLVWSFHELRWWDGSAWTAHVSDAGVTATDPA